MVVGVSGVSKAGDALDLELLALPLAHCGGNDARVLGSLSPIQMPRWAGANPLGELAIETLRYVGPAVKPDAAPSRLSPLVDGRIRHGLVVYDGGGSNPKGSASPARLTAQAHRATCRTKAPGAPIIPPPPLTQKQAQTTPEDNGRGQSADKTLGWDWKVEKNGARKLRVYQWTGVRYAQVIFNDVPAPPAR